MNRIDLKSGQTLVGTFMRKPAKAWRIMGSDQWCMRYFMPDESTYGPYPCYLSELHNMKPFPSYDEIFGRFGYYQDSIYNAAQFHAIYLP